MIHTARQLKDMIRNLSRKNQVQAHILIRNYMMERFLERVALSPYRNSFILKGGMLVAAMVGIDDSRATMDMDATIKGYPVSVETIENIISEIISVKIDDGVKFKIKSISEIMDDAEYSGVRVGMETVFDGVITPLKVDISTGDAITPREIQYEFKLMFEDRNISILAYPLETVLAEKLETVIARTTTNSRMRDFYDIYVLSQRQAGNIESKVLTDALTATANKRNTTELMKEAAAVLPEIASSEAMQKLWRNYQKKFDYASDISWQVVMDSLQNLCVKADLIVEKSSVLDCLHTMETDKQESRTKNKTRDDFER